MRPEPRRSRRISSTSRLDSRFAPVEPVDPIAGGVPPAPPSNIAAIIAGELAALAADAQTLGARLSTGDVVQATVLASNGLTDLLDIGGLRVAAELPPTLVPGEAITVMVTGFSGERINLRIITASQNAAAQTDLPADGPDAPARADGFPATPTQADVVVRPRAPAVAAAFTARTGRTPPPQAQGTPAILKTIEARLAAAHATTSRQAPSPAAGARDAKSVPAGAVRRTSSGPPVALGPAIGVRTPPAAAPRPAPVPLAAPKPAAPRSPARFREPDVFLRALRLPLTAANLATARIALESPGNVASALSTLERALADNTDPRVATLITLTSFLTRLDPLSPVLGAQIAAFVDQVVSGGEAKIAQLLGALDDYHAASERQTGAPPAPREPSGHDEARPTADLERIAVARARGDGPAGTTLPALAAERTDAASAAVPKSALLNAAVTGALTAITALQLNAAAVLVANPDGLAFTLPVALPHGVANAHVRIDRDAPDGKKMALDGDNFHIAFVLETRHFGTVGIDLLTVGRAVSVTVKTEAVHAQRRFGSALSELTARLEKLHYRVARADAVVLARPDAPAEPSGPQLMSDPARLVDIDA